MLCAVAPSPAPRAGLHLCGTRKPSTSTPACAPTPHTPLMPPRPEPRPLNPRSQRAGCAVHEDLEGGEELFALPLVPSGGHGQLLPDPPALACSLSGPALGPGARQQAARTPSAASGWLPTRQKCGNQPRQARQAAAAPPAPFSAGRQQQGMMQHTAAPTSEQRWSALPCGRCLIHQAPAIDSPAALLLAQHDPFS